MKVKTTKILVIGGGAREAALIWALKNTGSSNLELFCTPGNGGISEIAKCHPVKADDVRGLRSLVAQIKPDLTVVGPEAPLVGGITNFLSAKGYKVFGPTSGAARLKGSKKFAKEFMWRHKIPTVDAGFFDDPDKASAFIIKNKGRPFVVKADGLCQGKGVTVADTATVALAAVKELMIDKKFGPAGEKILIEEKLDGKECSFIVLTDGLSAAPFKPAADFKRRFDGNEGPNTGGMGCYSPVPEFTPELQEEVMERIVMPTIRGMAGEGNPYRGFLYFGLMLTEKGPFVLEYNVRMGDPEAAAILPLLRSDLSELLFASANGELAGSEVKWSDGSAICVVMAAENYPKEGSYGETIAGIKKAEETGALVFHAGTDKTPGGEIVTAGERILDIVGVGRTFPEAYHLAYAGVKNIAFSGMDYRQDIAFELAI